MKTVSDLTDRILLSPDEFLSAWAAHEQEAAVLALAARVIEARGDWAHDGSVTMAAWLRTHARMSQRDATRVVRRGRFLDRFTAMADAAVSGELSAGQIDALQAVYRPQHEPILASQQRELVQVLAPLNVDDAVKACHVWGQHADAIVDENEPVAEAERSLTMSRAGDRALLGRFLLDDAAATELEKAISNAITYEGAVDQRSLAQRQGDALFDIAAHFNKHHDGNPAGTPRHLPHVAISADASGLRSNPVAVNAETDRVLSAACTDTYLCDCKIHAIVRDADGRPEAFGRTRYTVSRRLFRQVAARDGGCRFPGCNRSVRFTDAHHITYWRRGGDTDYGNLVLLCNRHHHYVHQHDLHLKLLPSGDLHVTWHDGRERTSTPRGAPPRAWPASPLDSG